MSLNKGNNSEYKTQKTGKNTTPVTAIIPTLNEKDHIVAAINSVKFADEIIVIDSFSEDNTVALAQKAGARVLQRKFDDYSRQKNFAIDQAQNDWIFILDADERLTPALQNEIRNILQYKPEFDAYWVYRQNFFGKQAIHYSGWQQDKVLRLFNRKFCRYDGHLVHEEIHNRGKSGYLKEKIQHYSCKNAQEFKQKISKYAILKARELYQSGKKPYYIQLYLKPLYRFLFHYFIKGGILDGKNGYYIAAINAYGIKKRYRELFKRYKIKHTKEAATQKDKT